MMVQHHRKYKELHGEDEVVMMDRGEHIRLHQRLRRSKKCLVPATELRAISNAAYLRTEKGKKNKRKNTQRRNRLLNNIKNHFEFLETIGINVRLRERVVVNPNTGSISYGSWFMSSNGKKLRVIDI